MAKRFVYQSLLQAVQDERGSKAITLRPQTTLLLRDEVDKLEQRLCDLLVVEQCVAVSSGEEGLHLALLAAGIGPGERVLCSGFAPGFITRTILAVGAIPMLVDINPNTLNIDPFCLEYVLGKCRRTKQPLPKALVATDLFGLPCNYHTLTDICHHNGITLIEDMTQAMGASIGHINTGSFGRFAIASFWAMPEQPGYEDGGAVLCHNQEDALLIRDLLEKVRWETGAIPSADIASQEYVQACYGGQWLTDCMEHLEKRREVWDIYRQGLQGVGKIQQVVEPYHSACTQFVLGLPQPERREEILSTLERLDVNCTGFYRGERTMEDWDRVMLINARQAREKMIALPMSSYLTRHMAERIVEIITDQVQENT